MNKKVKFKLQFMTMNKYNPLWKMIKPKKTAHQNHRRKKIGPEWIGGGSNHLPAVPPTGEVEKTGEKNNPMTHSVVTF